MTVSRVVVEAAATRVIALIVGMGIQIAAGLRSAGNGIAARFSQAGNGGQGQYIYTFNGNTLDGVPTVADDTQASRWQGKLGIRIKF